MVLGLLGIFIIICLFFYLPYYFIRKQKQPKRNFPKKIYFGLGILGLFLFILGLSLDDGSASKVVELEKLNESLTAESAELKTKVKELEENIITLDTAVTDSEETIEALNKENTALTEKNDELTEELSTQEVEYKDLTKELSLLEDKNKDLTKEIKKLKESKQSTSSSESDSGTNQTASSSSTSNNDTASGDCDIKGSKNGIYHVPGSTYYNQTKNVVQWFCSEQEAENAGYRAPKR